MVQQYVEDWIVGPEDTKFYTRTYDVQNPKAHVVFVHGFQEHIARYDHFFPKFVARDISVFAFDQRGWGRTACDEAERSPGARYGWTSRPRQLTDLEFFIKREASRVAAGGQKVPLFLMGHSMGGGIVLSFATQRGAPPSDTTVALLSGLIASAPLIKQAHPAPSALRLVGLVLSKIIPWAPFPEGVPAEDLASDQAVGARAVSDPMMKSYASIQILNDIAAAGDVLAEKGWQNWPQHLPVLLVHGTSDKATSFNATEKFFKNLPVTDKTFTPYPNAYHEIHNEPAIWEREAEDLITWVEKHLPGGEGVAKL